MATRFYLPSSGAAAVSPTFNAGWGLTTGADRLAAVRTKISSAITSKSTNNSSTVQKILNRQYVSEPLAAQTISGTVAGQIRGSESNAGMDGVASIGIYVCNSAGTIVATLLAITNPTLSGNEYTTSLVNRNHPVSTAISSYACADGDRIVFEIGVSQQAASANRSATHSFGDASGSDMSTDQTSTTANNPWIEFSANLLFNTTTTRTQNGKARLQKVVTQLQTGKANIRCTTSRTQTGKAAIQCTTTRTQGGKACIYIPTEILLTDKFGGVADNVGAPLTAQNLTAHVPDSETIAPIKVWGKTGDLILHQTDSNSTSHNNQLSNNNGEAAYAYASKFYTDDQVVTMTIRPTSHINHFDDRMGMMVRADGSAGSKNGYEFRYNFNQNTFGYHELYSWVAGTATLIYSAYVSGETPGTSLWFYELSIIGSILTLKRDGQVLYSATNEAIAGSSSRRDFVLTAWNTDNTKSNNYIDDVTAADMTSFINNYGRIIGNVTFSADSPYQNKGTLSGAAYSADVPSAISGNVNSIIFRGTSFTDKVTLQHTAIVGKNAGAFSCRFKVNSFGASNHFILGSSVAGDYILQYESGNFYMTYRTGGSTSAPATINTGQWYHVVVNREFGITKFYLDNAPLTMATQLASVYDNYIDTFGLYSANPTSGHQFDGKMADPRIYAETLSLADIASLYAGGNGSKIPTYHWKFNEGSGTEALVQNTTDLYSTVYTGATSIYVRNSRRVTIGQNGALSMWVRRDNVNDSFGSLVSGAGSGLELPNGTQMNVSLYNGSSPYSYTCALPFTMLDNIWYNIIINRKNGYTYIYLNGMLETTYGGVSQQGYSFYVDLFSSSFIGRRANVKIYHDTLSATDIIALAAGGNARMTPLHHWKMDENSGLILKDYGIYDQHAHRNINAILGGGDTLTLAELHATHCLAKGLKSDQLLL